MKRFLILTVSIVIFWGCGSQKATSPSWVQSKPIDNQRTFVYGIGMSYINPNAAYQQAARANALADLAGEVESQVFDESRLLQTEDASGFSSAFSSKTLTKSHIKLEGYEVVDTFSDDLRYYVLYRLNLSRFLERKAINDAIALDYINEKLTVIKHKPNSISIRFQALADGLQKAFDRAMLQDPKFKIELNAKFLSGLRTIENDLAGNIVVSETTQYLGLPSTFSAFLEGKESDWSEAIKLGSSSGKFTYNSATGAIACMTTGKENDITLEGRLDFQRLLPKSDAWVHRWLEETCNWTLTSRLHFQDTEISIIAPKALNGVISEAISTDFSCTKEAPLTLEFRGTESVERNLGDRTKHIISGSFVLRGTNETVIWSSQRLSKFAISNDPKAAKRAAHEEFDKDIRFFILPQITRSLAY